MSYEYTTPLLESKKRILYDSCIFKNLKYVYFIAGHMEKDVSPTIQPFHDRKLCKSGMLWQ